MLSGFNTNYRYRGVLFHVQTEDSGRANPHVITHLFHGGNILASEKRDYSDQLEGSDPEVGVRAIMETQHKSMLTRLKSGHYDATIVERVGPTVFKDSSDTDATIPPAEPAVPVESSVPAAAGSPSEDLAHAFGDGVVSQKPLDEVVLEYLVENARKRKKSARSR